MSWMLIVNAPYDERFFILLKIMLISSLLNNQTELIRSNYSLAHLDYEDERNI